MSRHMRTTVRLDDRLLEQVKREAARRHETLTALIEQGLRLVLAKKREPPRRRSVKLPVCHAGGGTLPGIDLNDSAALLDVMETRR
jgi:ribbon-helix-helix CopG family protein